MLTFIKTYIYICLNSQLPPIACMPPVLCLCRHLFCSRDGGGRQLHWQVQPKEGRKELLRSNLSINHQLQPAWAKPINSSQKRWGAALYLFFRVLFWIHVVVVVVIFVTPAPTTTRFGSYFLNSRIMRSKPFHTRFPPIWKMTSHFFFHPRFRFNSESVMI